MAQHVGALSALLEDAGSLHIIHILAHNYLYLEFQGTQCSLWPPWAPDT